MTTDIYIPPKELSACFTGHRAIPHNMKDILTTRTEVEIGWLVSHGITNFIAGGALGYDTLAALAVLRERRFNHQVRLHLYLPSPVQSARWSWEDRQLYNEIRDAADTVSIIGPNNSAQCMHMRNRAMVNASSYCIAYYNPATQADPRNPRGGTYATVRYAVQRGLMITNVNDAHPAELRTDRDFII